MFSMSPVSLKLYLWSESLTCHHHPCCMPHPFLTPRFDRTSIWRGVLIMKLITKQLSQPPVASSLSGPNILLSTLLSNTIRPCSSLNPCLKFAVPHRSEQHSLCLLAMKWLSLSWWIPYIYSQCQQMAFFFLVMYHLTWMTMIFTAAQFSRFCNLHQL
jgi:hypothetical protein